MQFITQINLQAICIKENPKIWDSTINKKRQLVMRTCYGIMVSYEEHLYVLTCYHFIKNNLEIKGMMIHNDKIKEITLVEKGSCIPYDVSVLIIKNDDHFLKNINGDNKFQFCMTLNDLKNKTFVLNNTIIENNEIKNTENISRCEYDGIESCEYGTNMYPYIPSIIIKILNVNDYSGLSGSALYDSEHAIYGMISHCDQINNVVVLPSYCLLYILDNIINNRNLTGILIGFELCDYVDSNDMDQVGYIITTTFGIKYCYTKTTLNNRTKKMKLNKGDVISKIDNKSFKNDGKIHSSQLNIDINIDAYIMLENFRSNTIMLEFSQYNSDKIIVDAINKIPLENYNIFDIEQNTNFIEYNGLIITELSENLYKYFAMNGYIFSGLINWYYNNHIRSDGYKPVIIVDIVENSKYVDKYKKLGLPFIKITDDNNDDSNNSDCRYYLSIISKFDDTKIMNLNQLKDAINNSSSVNHVMKIYIDNKTSTYKLTFIDDIQYNYNNTNSNHDTHDISNLEHNFNKLTIDI